MKITMNKQLYTFAQCIIQKNRPGERIKNSVLTKRLHEDYHFGQMDLAHKQLTFSLTDVLNLSEETRRTLGVDIRNDPYPNKEDRLTTAGKFRNEKANSLAVSKDFILINSLSTLKVNQSIYELSPLTSLGNYVKADEIQSVEHSAIVLVENLAVMANLSEINLTAIESDIDLTQALWLYRGDIKAQQSTNTSYQFFRRFNKSIPLICFSDLDPKGIEIALTSNADYWLTLKDSKAVDMPLQGNEQEWYKQGASIFFLLEQIKETNLQSNGNTENHSWQNVFSILLTHRKTLKQEHMLKHKLALSLIVINT